MLSVIKFTFEGIMAIVGCVTAVLLAFKGILVIIKEAINAIPGIINGWKKTVAAWRNRHDKEDL